MRLVLSELEFSKDSSRGRTTYAGSMAIRIPELGISTKKILYQIDILDHDFTTSTMIYTANALDPDKSFILAIEPEVNDQEIESLQMPLNKEQRQALNALFNEILVNIVLEEFGKENISGNKISIAEVHYDANVALRVEESALVGALSITNQKQLMK